MTYLEELFEKADRLCQDVRIIDGLIYLGPKLYDTFTTDAIKPLLNTLTNCPNGRYKDYCFTAIQKDNALYLTHIADCHDGIVAMQIAKLTAEIEGGNKLIVLPPTTAKEILTQFYKDKTVTVDPNDNRVVIEADASTESEVIVVFPHYAVTDEAIVLDVIRDGNIALIVSDNVKLPYHNVVFL